MDLVIALGIPLTIIFTTDSVPTWVYNINSKYRRKTWLYGVIALSTGSLLIAMFRR